MVLRDNLFLPLAFYLFLVKKKRKALEKNSPHTLMMTCDDVSLFCSILIRFRFFLLVCLFVVAWRFGWRHQYCFTAVRYSLLFCVPAYYSPILIHVLWLIIIPYSPLLPIIVILFVSTCGVFFLILMPTHTHYLPSLHVPFAYNYYTCHIPPTYLMTCDISVFYMYFYGTLLFSHDHPSFFIFRHYKCH